MHSTKFTSDHPARFVSTTVIIIIILVLVTVAVTVTVIVIVTVTQASLQTFHWHCSHHCQETQQTYHSPVLPEMISAYVFHVVSKAFIKPQVIPPLHSDQVTKPLVRKLVSHDNGHILLVSGARGSRVTQHVGLAEREYSPVFHGSGSKIRHSDQIWGKDQLAIN